MKTRLLLAVLLLPAMAAPLLARDGTNGPRNGRHHGDGIERMDTDQDGRISRAEFDAGRAAREARIAQHPQRQHAGKRADTTHQPTDFTTLDANRDGYIVRSEERAYRERMRPQREAERTARFEARFVEADLNRDGKLGRTEVSEKMPRMSDRFAWLDENRDGFLTRAELQSGRAR